MIAVWCPDWPVTAACSDTGMPDLSDQGPVAVVTANRVVACSHEARTSGVRRGLRRREAQARCPELAVLPRNEAAEARLFEPIVLALESIAPGVEVTRPGLAAIGVRGPTRYFGSETGVLHALSRAVGAAPAVEAPGAGITTSTALIGVADGSFAAEQAARQGVIVPAGESPPFLADLPVSTLDPSGDSPLIDLLRRLGLRTLGAFAALPGGEVHTRFGPDGAWAHRQAGGHDDRPLAARRPPAELVATLDLEPPVDRVDTVAFSARAMAEQFIGDLAGHGLACACLELQVLTENGEETVRRWRHAGVLSTVDVVDRIRWQLEGWLRGGEHPPSGGVTRLRLLPIETVPLGVHQQALWGGSGADDERAHRALARVQTLLGHGSVLTPMIDGGRDPLQRTRLVPWGDAPVPEHSPEHPWPGHLPAPAPSVLIDPPRPVRVLDATGRTVTVDERGVVPSPPATFVLGRESLPVTSWAGPWPVDERWWTPDATVKVARFQLVDVAGRAYLVTYTTSDEHWTLTATYD
ncbi:MAG TPA: DNA polymerase Y family protein [Jatrophihabitantaceae bacterium]|jgi:protein ImuB